MMLPCFFAIAATLFIRLISANDAENYNNGFDKVAISPPVDSLSPDALWKYFQFTNPGAFALTRYEFILPSVDGNNQPFPGAILQVVDLFCKGDAYIVADNGNIIGQTSLSLPIDCTNSTEDPNAALLGGGWATVGVYLGPGSHNITIQMTRSPWTAGTAAIRLLPILL